MNTVADSIKRLVDEKGIKNKAVATRAGFTEQQFSDMLNGRKVIRAEYMPRIAAALGVEVGEIYRVEERSA